MQGYCECMFFFISVCLPKSQMAGYSEKCLFVLIRNCQIVFQNIYSILNSQHQPMRIPSASHSCKHLVFSVFSRKYIYYFHVFYLAFHWWVMTFEHLFMNLLFGCCKVSVTIFALFLKIGIFVFSLIYISLYILEKSSLANICMENTSPSLWLAFHFLKGVFWCPSICSFDKIKFPNLWRVFNG